MQVGSWASGEAQVDGVMRWGGRGHGVEDTWSITVKDHGAMQVITEIQALP